MNFRQLSAAIFLTIFFSTVFVPAQTFKTGPDDILATAGNQSFTGANLPPNVRQVYESQKIITANARITELESVIGDALVEEEAKFRKISVDKLLEETVRRVADPSENEIKAVYEANRDQFGTATLAEARPRIVSFLRQEPENKAMGTLITSLQKKFKIVPGVDVNSPTLKPTDTVVTIGTRKILADWFNEKAKPGVYFNALQAHNLVMSGLENAVYANLILTEARNLKLEPEELIAKEITDKMQEQTDAERARLEALLRDRLFKKYDAKFLLLPPETLVQKVSVDDDPSQGNPKAPVTILMFSDFQCSVCSLVHPIVKEVMQAYGDKVRLVVRDYPLPSVHANAQKAAEAAGAANAQGKFFEYIEILYKNQNALDNASLKKYATQIGLDRVKFDAELDKGVYAAEIAKDLEDGEFYGIRGTPTLFINGMRVTVNSVEEMKKLIDKALSQKPSPNQ